MTTLLASIAVLTIIGASCSEQTIDSKPEAISETNKVIIEPNESNGGFDAQFIVGSDLGAHRERFSAITLNDGRIMAVGGKAIGLRNVEMGNFEDSTEILDINTMTWKLTGDMNEKRKSPGLAQLNDQTVIAAGGCEHKPLDPLAT